MDTDVTTIRKPKKIIEIDESVTEVIVKRRNHGFKIKYEPSAKNYIVQRTAKDGLQMIGA